MGSLHEESSLSSRLIHTAAIPVSQQLLGGFHPVLTKAQAQADDKKIDRDAWLQARLCPDMFLLLRQLQIATGVAKSVSAWLAGADVPKLDDQGQAFADLQARIQTVLASLKNLAAAWAQEAPTRSILTQPDTPKGRHSTGAAYALLHFFFHPSTAHMVLRHSGMEVGKKDAVGAHEAAW